MGAPRDAVAERAGETAAPRLTLTNVSKRYPGVQANDRVNLEVMPGEIHAVLGENGAGKSTLMKIIYGAVRPDEGRICAGTAPRWRSHPAAGARAGDRDGVPALRAVRGADRRRERLAGPGRDLSRATLGAEVRRVAADCTASTSTPSAPVSQPLRRRAPAGRDPARAAHRPEAPDPRRADVGADAPGGGAAVRHLAASSRASGCAILYISHKLDEVRSPLHALHGAAGGAGHRRRRSASPRPTAPCRS